MAKWKVIAAGLIIVGASVVVGVGTGYALWGNDAEPEPVEVVTLPPQYPFFRDVAVPRYLWLAYALDQNLTPECSALGPRFQKLYDALDETGRSNLLKNVVENSWTEITCTVPALSP